MQVSYKGLRGCISEEDKDAILEAINLKLANRLGYYRIIA